MFEVDGKLWSFLDLMTDLVLLNLLFILFSVPLFTIGASKVALISLTDQVVKRENKGVLKPFFTIFCEKFKGATIKWMMYLLCMLLLGVNLFSLTQMSLNTFTFFLSMATTSAFFIINASFLFSLFIDVYDETNLYKSLKKGIALSIAFFPKTLIMIGVEMLPWILIFFFTHHFLYVLTAYFVIGYSIGAIINRHIYYSIFTLLKK